MIYTDEVHLVADSLEELHEFAKSIGLSRNMFEGVKKNHPHYDLIYNSGNPVYDEHGKKMSDKVIEYGAKVVRKREILFISKKIIKQTKIIWN